MADHHRLMLDELRSDLDTVESERKRLDLRHERIHAAIALLEEKIQTTGERQPQVSADPETEAGSGVYAMMSMPQAVRHCLSTSSRPLSKREVMSMLREGGKPEGNHFSQAVYNTLHRLSKNGGSVRRENDGRWSFVDKSSDSAPSLIEN